MLRHFQSRRRRRGITTGLEHFVPPRFPTLLACISARRGRGRAKCACNCRGRSGGGRDRVADHCRGRSGRRRYRGRFCWPPRCPLEVLRRPVITVKPIRPHNCARVRCAQMDPHLSHIWHGAAAAAHHVSPSGIAVCRALRGLPSGAKAPFEFPMHAVLYPVEQLAGNRRRHRLARLHTPRRYCGAARQRAGE